MSHLLLHFSRSEIDDLLVLERGEGPYVFDHDGRRYIDALSSLFCAQIGYRYGAEMAAAAARQLTTLAFNTNWGTAHPAALELAERLADLAPIDVTHVANTNAFRDEGDPDTFCARLLAEVEAAILAAGPDEVALIIAEPVQNSGGCLTAPDGYWRGLRELADRYGALLMADEVITGCGRLGEWFGVAREGVVPALVSLAKGLTSAYAPMGAVVAREHVAPAGVFRHGITFGGHPLCAAIALTNLEIFARDGVLEHARALEPHLEASLRELRALPIVGDMRGAGFFWAVELVRDEQNTRLDQAERDELLRGFLPRRLREAGLIARADDRGDSVLQIAPPLISDASLLDEIVDRLGEVLVEAGDHMTAGVA